MSLYHKYRPKDLDQIIGNKDTIAALEGMLGSLDSCPHSFLLQGQTGCGKTTIARIIANRLGCVGHDFREVNTADLRGIDTIREIIHQAHFKSLEGPVRVWLIDECHKLTGDAQNALLKMLEDPPGHVYFILCTTEPQKLLKTIRGRCSLLSVSPLTEIQTYKLLKFVAKSEGERLQSAIYKLIYTSTQGHPRNALQILDQVLAVSPDERLEVAKRAELLETESIALCRALLSNAEWKVIREILNGLKNQEAEGIRRHVLGYAQSVLLKSDTTRAGAILEEFLEPFFNTGFPGLVYACYSLNYK